MPRVRTDTLELYPYRVTFRVKTFEPGEYVAVKPEDYKGDDFVEGPRGETQLVVGIDSIYYDAKQNRGDPDWVLLAESENSNKVLINVAQVILENEGLRKAKEK